MTKGLKILEQTLDKLEKLKQESLVSNDFAFSRGVTYCKYIVESAYVEILALENDKRASNRRQSNIL